MWPHGKTLYWMGALVVWGFMCAARQTACGGEQVAPLSLDGTAAKQDTRGPDHREITRFSGLHGLGGAIVLIGFTGIVCLNAILLLGYRLYD